MPQRLVHFQDLVRQAQLLAFYVFHNCAFVAGMVELSANMGQLNLKCPWLWVHRNYRSVFGTAKSTWRDCSGAGCCAG